MLTLALSTFGLPLKGVGPLLAIDPIMDMIRTAANVAGQMTVPILVAKSEGLLDRDVCDATPRPLDEDPVAAAPESAPGSREPELQPAA